MPLYVVCLVSSLGLSSCTPQQAQEAVVIEKHKEQLATKYLEDAPDKSQIPIKPTEQAVTVWDFPCGADIAFDITEKDQFDKDCMVTVKVKSVKMILDAPITIWISKTAPEHIVKHENAHVRICQRVYKNADAVARQAAKNVIGKSYQASGPNIEAACKEAILNARREACETYHLNTVEQINRVSEVFDGLESHYKDKSPESLVDVAFSQYIDISENKGKMHLMKNGRDPAEDARLSRLEREAKSKHPLDPRKALSRKKAAEAKAKGEAKAKAAK